MDEIKAVTFDVGGTLATGHLKERTYRLEIVNFLRSNGFNVTAADCRRSWEKALKRLSEVRNKHLEMKFEEFCAISLRNLNIAPRSELLEGLRSLYFKCFPQTVVPGAREVLSKLSSKFKLGVISNSMSLLPKHFLEANGLDKYFQTVVVSGDIGRRKPHPDIFRVALEKLEVSPGETVHVGNLLEEDAVGAKVAGMYAVLISPKGIDAEGVKPDIVVGSISEVPQAIENLSSPNLREIMELLGDRCMICSSEGVNLYEISRESEDEVQNYVVLCPECHKEISREKPSPRQRRGKKGKYRATYRRAWSKLHAAYREKG